MVFPGLNTPVTFHSMKIAELLQSLTDENVQFVLVGGLAVQLHGFLRSTFDIDLVLAMDDANLSRFIDVAKRFSLMPVMPVPIDSLRNPSQIDQWHREKGMLAFALREPQAGGSVVDVLVRPDVPFEKLMSDAVSGELFGRQVCIASIDNLLLMKRIANRPKDLLDISVIPQALMLQRLAQSEQMREFFIQMWLQNPALTTQGGARVQTLLSPLPIAAPEKQKP